jgi:hypothetical protein
MVLLVLFVVGHNPFRVVPDVACVSQGSSFLATLGFVAESLWDSALGATHSKMRVRSGGLPALLHARLHQTALYLDPSLAEVTLTT